MIAAAIARMRIRSMAFSRYQTRRHRGQAA
jgi:hypothetical protein